MGVGKQPCQLRTHHVPTTNRAVQRRFIKPPHGCLSLPEALSDYHKHPCGSALGDGAASGHGPSEGELIGELQVTAHW